ncbi:hypothetical protein Z969_04990 [Clostridium novyi A str. 4570]|uniref:Uncharacterized protein n=1 Tax=Clostridium novyi A str. 4570 TaxID=1444290 RepID=A0AA88ZQV5_CLONO|nr:hypothetical protein [Clostridium novyi]KGN02439.1 hypothetical protein Z969_04990 [Clostridium novyi A str. 4570]
MKKIISILLVIISIASLFISIKLFWNTGIFVDEYNLTPSIVNGGQFWSSMDWIRLLLLAIMSILCIINLYLNKRK